MVNHMASDYIRERSNREGVLARNSFSQPGLGREVAKKGERCRPNCYEIVDVGRPTTLIGVRRVNCDVLVETRHGRVKPPGKPKCAGRKHAFRVVDMPQRLADAPFVGRVTIERLVLRNS